jgi:hypothetical protein
VDPPDRTRLHFGPYRTPQFQMGAVVSCEIRGHVVIVGLSAGRIPWPIGRRRGTSARGPVLFADLARAVRKEANAAVCHWWGVTPQTVTKWRKALGVGAVTAGTSRLRSAIAQTEAAIVEGLSRAQEKARDPERDGERREKIAAARAGKPRPRSVVQAMRKGRTGKPHDGSWRQRDLYPGSGAPVARTEAARDRGTGNLTQVPRAAAEYDFRLRTNFLWTIRGGSQVYS